MTLNPSRSSVGGTLEDHLFRVRALEAERPLGVGGPVAVDLRNPSFGCYFRPKDRNFGPPVGYTLGFWHFVTGVDAWVTGIVQIPDRGTGEAILFDVSGTVGGDVGVECSTYAIPEGATWDGVVNTEPTQTVTIGTSRTTVRFPATGTLITAPQANDLLVVRVGHLGAGDGYGGIPLCAGVWLEVGGES